MIPSIDQSLAQQIVNTVKDVCGQNINFITPKGIISASTDEKRIGTYHEIGQKAAATGNVIEVDSDYGFAGTQKGINLPIYHNHNLIAVIGISGEPEEVRKYAHLAERITHLLIRERELNAFSRSQEEKKQFVIHALISGLDENPLYLNDCLKDFKIDPSTKKRLILIRTNSKYNPVNMPMLDQKVENLFRMLSQELFTFNYPNEYLAILDAEKYNRNNFILRKFAADYENILKVAVGKEVFLHQMQESHHSALIAWKSIPDGSKSFAVFDDLVLEIILSTVTEENKTEFVKKTLEPLAQEEIEVLSVYLEEEMSLSAASKRLFLHKNTVQYKLNRILEKTGWNPRKFQDAVLFFLALKLES